MTEPRLSISELLKQLRELNVAPDKIAGCIERPDYEELLKKTLEGEFPGKSKAKKPPSETKQAEPKCPKPGAAGTEGPFGMSWQNIIIFGLFLAYYGGSYITTLLGGSSSDDSSGIYSDDGYLSGKVFELRTHGDFKQAMALHKDSTGLPVVVDFYSVREALDKHRQLPVVGRVDWV